MDVGPSGNGLQLMLITSSPEVAREAEQAGVDRIFVDLEVNGKQERQKNRNTVISGHTLEDVGAVSRVLEKAQLLVRVNPLHSRTLEEVDRAIGLGADLLMLPMFRSARELETFCGMVAGRAGVIGLVETPEAVQDLAAIARVPGLSEVHVGLNDLSLALGLDFLFEPLASGMIDQIASVLRDAGVPFGFGGIARIGQGQLPAEMVLGEHVRSDSRAVILSREFHGGKAGAERMIVERLNLTEEISRLRSVEAQLRRRTPEEIERDRLRTKETIERIAAQTRRSREGSSR
jgi:2-keto-3-deoxy-L-rhamnonate aldolase RhmA